MQPFNKKTLFAILLAVSIYLISYFLFNNIAGWLGIIIRAIFFSSLFGISILYWKISPDAIQLLAVFKERVNIKN
jgi:hypothetical protein